MIGTYPWTIADTVGALTLLGIAAVGVWLIVIGIRMIRR